MVKSLLSTALLATALSVALGMRPVAHGQSMTSGTPPTGQLSNEGLRQILEGMGLEPKPLSKGFLITLKRDTWSIYIQLLLSDNQAKLGMNANCGLVPDPDTITAAQWKALLIANGDIDPSSFYFDNDKKKLYVHRVLDNRAVTPAILRWEIERFADNVHSTGDLWKFTK